MSTNKIIRTLLFVVDIAGDMIGGAVAAVDRAINDAAREIHAFSSARGGVEFKINVLGFYGERATWLAPKPKSVNEFSCNLAGVCGEVTHGDAKLSVACDELLAKLSNGTFLDESTNSFDPVIFMLINHELNDKDIEALRRLQSAQTLITLIVAGSNIPDGLLNEFDINMHVFDPVFHVDRIYGTVRGMATWSARLLAGGDVRLSE